MSTKIFNGRKIDSDLSVSELFEKTQAIEAKCKLKINALVKELIANKLTYIIDYSYNIDSDYNWLDHFFLHGIDNIDTTLLCLNNISACRFLLKIIEEKRRQITKTGGRDPEYDFDLSIGFFGLRDKILYLTNTEQFELMGIIDEELEGEDYSYWNNIDPPEDISESEWQQRSQDWNIIDERPLTFNLYDTYDYLSHVEIDEQIIDFISDSDYRAYKLAYSELVLQYIYKNKQTGEPSEIVKLSREAHNFYNDNEKSKEEFYKFKQSLYIHPVTRENLFDLKMSKGKFITE